MNFDGSNRGKLSNENHVSEMSHVLRYTRPLFNLIGIWPRVASNPTRVERLVSRLMLPISFLSMLTSLVFLALHIVLEDSSRSELLLMVGPLIFQSTCVLKHVALFYRSRFTKICMEHMETDWRRIDNENDRSIMMKNVKIGHDVTLVISSCTYSCGLFYHAIMPLWMRESTNKLNETVVPRAFAGADLIVDPWDGYNYEIIFCGECVSAFFLYTIVSSSGNLAVILVTHACGQIELVIFRLENLLSSDDRKDIGSDVVAHRMAIIVHCHVRGLK